MHREVNPMLIHHLQGRVLELEQVDAEQMLPAERARHNQALRNARLSLARARGSHTHVEWEAIVAECDRNCVRCGRHHPEPLEPVKGHIRPIAIGGSDAADNLMPLCRQCASARGDEGIDWLAAYRETHGKPAPTPAEGA